MTREPWFAPGEYGTLSPVNNRGCLAFVAASAWLMFSTMVGGVVLFLTLSPWAILVPFVLGAPGLAAFFYVAITRTAK